MEYYHDFWIGYLTEQMIRQVVEMALIKCSGCSDKMHSPMLHLHHQLSLLEKLKCYFDEVKGSILYSIEASYEQFEDKLPHSNGLNKAKNSMLTMVDSF